MPHVNCRMTVLAGPASVRLGAKICELLGVAPAPYECRRFPDGEALVELRESVRGRDVYVIQSTSPPVEQHLIELLLLGDASRRAGAARLTAVIPYFGYARQDRRSGRRSLGAAVAARVISTAGFDRVMLIDAHTPAIEGFFEMPIDHLTAAPFLAAAVTPQLPDNAVVVAPDLGAVKLAREYARLLHRPIAVIHKTRRDGEAVEAHAVIGDVRNQAPILVDDMLSTGATIQAAAGALRHAGAVDPITVVVTHALLVGRARERLQQLGIARIVAGDTVEIDAPVEPWLEVTSVATLLATAIQRDHRDESLADLRAPA